jgi:hypothetical protein
MRHVLSAEALLEPRHYRRKRNPIRRYPASLLVHQLDPLNKALLLLYLDGHSYWEISEAGASSLVWNVLSGLAIIPLKIWLVRKYGDHTGQLPRGLRVINDIARYKPERGAEFIRTLARFEEEDPSSQVDQSSFVMMDCALTCEQKLSWVKTRRATPSSCSRLRGCLAQAQINSSPLLSY